MAPGASVGYRDYSCIPRRWMRYNRILPFLLKQLPEPINCPLVSTLNAEKHTSQGSIEEGISLIANV